MRLLFSIRFPLLLIAFLYGTCLLFPRISSAQNLTFQIEESTVKMGEEMCANIMVQNFDLIGFQFTISWDSTILEYTRVIDAKVPYFVQSSYQNFPDMFRVAWINESVLSSIELPNNSPVFSLCFTPKKTGASMLYFDETPATPLQPEFINLEGILNATLIDGEVRVVGCTPYNTNVARTICQGDSFENYTESGQYTNAFTTADGCDSVRTLDLTVLSAIQTNMAQTICEGDAFEGYTQSGQYTDTFRAYTGCDSIRVLQLTVLSEVQSSFSQTICAGDSYEGYRLSGQYTDTFTATSGCDSSRTLVLTVQPVIETTLSKTICEGDNYGGRVVAGTYIDTYSSAIMGCDSVRTLFLSVTSSIQTSDTRAICQGSCLRIAGEEICDAGIYNLQFASAAGCDSLVQLTVQVVEQMFGTSSIQLCSGEFWIEGGTALDKAGSYNFMYTSSTGCDSLHTLQLSFFEEDLNTSSVVNICEGENYGGRTIPGVYRDEYTSINGCDSAHTITLTVVAPIEREEIVNICQGQSYGDYSLSGRYVDTFMAASGCDSTRILNLTVSNMVRSTITATICEGENFEGFMATGVYENSFSATSGCDSIRTLTLTVLPQAATTIETSICAGESFEGFTNAGTYTNSFISANGCDSIRRLVLSILPTDNVSCQSTPTIDLNASLSVSIYPNPIQTNLFIEWSELIPVQYTLLDMSGKVLLSKSSTGSLSTIDFSHFLSGVYYLKIDTKEGSHFAKLLKL